MEVIKDKSGLPQQSNVPRTNQQHLLPSAVKQRQLGEIITGNPDSTAPGSGVSTGVFVMANTTSASVVFTLQDFQDRVTLVSPDVAVFFNTISAVTEWPNGSQNMGNFPVCIFNDWALTDNANTKTRIQMYNNTGGPLNVIVVYRARVITNPVSGAETDNV